VRTSNDDLVIYKAFHPRTRSSSELWTTALRWVKLSQQHVPRYTEDAGSEEQGFESTLLALDNVNGYSTVFQRGLSPAFILKESSSAPRVIGLSGKPVKSLTRFHTSSCLRGFAYLDTTDTLRISQLPPNTHYGHLGWATQRMPMDAEVHALAYHPSGLYIIGTGQQESYTLNPDDTFHYELPKEDATMKPHVERGEIRVLDEQTWNLIDTHILDPQETILCIKKLNLEVSEITHQRKDLIAVGTAIIQGEDLATKGQIRIFEVITVVPEPDRPETNKKLKLIVKDEVKGAVSAVSDDYGTGTKESSAWPQRGWDTPAGRLHGYAMLCHHDEEPTEYWHALDGRRVQGRLVYWLHCKLNILRAEHSANKLPGRALQDDALRAQ
jgi:cleavage and polyadenylation specificity factor subunit 1